MLLASFEQWGSQKATASTFLQLHYPHETLKKNNMASTPTVKLASGDAMPLTGLGLWKVPRDVAADQVYNAIKAGYRLLDGAADYANEKECGQGLARALKEGIVKREEVFIVSKLWNTNHAAKHVEPACRKSLSDWGVEYFDLYLIHMPIPLAYGKLTIPRTVS